MARQLQFWDEAVDAYNSTSANSHTEGEGNKGEGQEGNKGEGSSTEALGLFSLLITDVKHIANSGSTVSHTDAELARWLRAEQASGRLERTALFIFSDHGPRVGITRQTYRHEMISPAHSFVSLRGHATLRQAAQSTRKRFLAPTVHFLSFVLSYLLSCLWNSSQYV